MPRVSHKRVMQLIAQKQKTISDRQFFTSRILAGHFADMAAVQTRRYGYSRRVKVRIVWEPKTKDLASVEHELIWINAGHPMVTGQKSRQNRYNAVCGLFAHELGHVLYTDFLSAQTHGNRFTAGNWYPEKPLIRSLKEQRHEADIWDYTKRGAHQLAALLSLMHELHNVLEDGYIESRMLNQYPGVLGECLAFSRKIHFEMTPTLTQMKEYEAENSHIWRSILQIMLSYVKWGEIKYGDEPISDERVQTVFSLIGELDSALIDPSAKERLNVVNTILVRCWSYIKDFLEWCEEKAQEALAAGVASSPGGIVIEVIGSLSGASKRAAGLSEPVKESPGVKNPPSAAGKRAATVKLTQEADVPADEEQNETPEAVLNDCDEMSSSPEPHEDAVSEGDGSESESTQDVTADEKGRIPLTQTDRLYEPTGGSVEYDDDYQGGGYANTASDIERLLEQMAEKSVHTQLEKERTSELNDLANAISYGDIHSGVSMKVHRMTDVDDGLKEQYQQIAPELLHISKLLQRSIAQQLQDKRRGGKQTNLLMGRRLDIHALPRNDGRVFYKNALPNETPELAIALLLDESGSMCSGDRSTYARAAAIILYDFCRTLDIPIMVYGHSTGGNSVDLYSYAEYESIDRDDRYRMMDISSRSSNRDGAALRYVAERLANRTEDIRILMLVSDGQPADSGYTGTAAEEDLRGIKLEYKRKGILFIAAAIGDDKLNIQRIYGESFLDITDLNKLPVMLADVVKRHIRA